MKAEYKSQPPAPRTVFNLEVQFRKSYARAISNGRLRNISLTGAYLECTEFFHLQERFQFHFFIGGQLHFVAAETVWRSSNGYGVKFITIKKRDTRVIEDVVQIAESMRYGKQQLLSNILKSAS